MAEEKFYDTQPTGENTDVEYRDPTDVDEVEDEIKHGQISPIAQKFALWIRTKMYRRHVREALARMMEYSSVLFNNIKAIADRTEKRQESVEGRQDSLEQKYREQIAGNTDISEVIDARHSNVTNETFGLLGERLDEMEVEQHFDRLTNGQIRLEDPDFLKNHEVIFVKNVPDPDIDAALFIGTVDAEDDGGFKFEKVGEV